MEKDLALPVASSLQLTPTSPASFLRRLADDAGVIVWEASISGPYQYVGSAARRARPVSQRSGYLELSLKDWLEFIHPEDVLRVERCVTQAREQRREYQVQYRILCSDGTVRWVAEAAAPKFGPDRSSDTYIGTFLDVSESHEARARLARSEMEHRLLTENARDMISHTDANDIYVYVSPSHKDTLGYEAHEMLGTRLYDYIHPEDQELPAEKRKRRGLLHIRFRHKNGSWVWLGATTRTLRDPATNAKLGTVSIAREITAQIEAERELQRREERFRSLISLSSDWYWETDAELRFTFFSEGIYHKLRVKPEQLLGSSFRDHAQDPHAPGLLVCLESIRERRSFHDVIFPAASAVDPELVRFLRISGEPFFDNGIFHGYRGVSRDVTREVRTSRALERLATLDILTELPNRALLQTSLRQRLDSREAGVFIAVFFIDLDNFKEVNDSFGHAAGDILLKEIAIRLNRCVRSDDTVARLGGDEFVVVAECRNGESSAKRLAEKLTRSLDLPILIKGHEVKASASIGISMYPQDGDTSESLLQSADTALYRAKAFGGGTYRFFTADMGAASRSRLVMQAALRHAVARNELQVYYQPRVHLQSHTVTGVEALLRWMHPDLGTVPPSEFIPLAEEIGLINDIGDWVLRRATMQVQQWSRHFGRPLKVSVNLSARQIRTNKLVRSVGQALQASGLPPDQLELELTESALMEDADVAACLLRELKSLGLRISVDDFGTGYSSLAYLGRFPLDSLKLDRSFLAQADKDGSWKLAEAVINLAHTLDLSVVAEGVEKEEHLAFLRTTACDEIQGTCISEPLAPLEAERLLQDAFARRSSDSR
ncbi:sensor domain-containing protein [Noviherbaspirillum aerium]|uniref:sensor domain-containing protein n=1 Tax=Noviherbaspirillum aerium TaxID=2588497 RepID=UPI00124E85F6|nr:bifunctional diguanylate cyclase/phosphodiesterase [Noviherbaspirillum aerium]